MAGVRFKQPPVIKFTKRIAVQDEKRSFRGQREGFFHGTAGSQRMIFAGELDVPGEMILEMGGDVGSHVAYAEDEPAKSGLAEAVEENVNEHAAARFSQSFGTVLEHGLKTCSKAPTKDQDGDGTQGSVSRGFH